MMIQIKFQSKTKVWVDPQATLRIGLLGSCQTSFAIRVCFVLLSSFCSRPNCPSLPLPTISSLPSSVTRAVCAPPHTMFLTLAFRLATLLGRNWSDLSPCPNCPSFPNPHVYTSPLSVTTPEQLSPAEMSTIFQNCSDSTRIGSYEFLRPPSPSCPLPLLPQTQTFPSSSKAMLKFMPDETFTIWRRGSSTMSFLVLAWLLLIPLTFVSPITNTFPSLFTNVMYSPAHEAMTTFSKLTLTGALPVSVFCGSVVPIDLNLGLGCSNPQTKASPFSVTAHIDWYPHET